MFCGFVIAKTCTSEPLLLFNELVDKKAQVVYYVLRLIKTKKQKNNEESKKMSEQITIPEEENFISDTRKAELMAHAEDPFQTMAKNAREAGMDEEDINSVLGLGHAKSEAVAEQYDTDQANIARLVSEAAHKVAEFQAEKPSKEIIIFKAEKSDVAAEALGKLYGLLGVSGQRASAEPQKYGDDWSVTLRTNALKDANELEIGTTLTTTQQVELSSPMGFVVSELEYAGPGSILKDKGNLGTLVTVKSQAQT